MPTYFPQVNSNMIITQLPYTAGQSYESVSQELETGMRYSYPRRAAGLDEFPTGPLSKFQVNFTNITDDEVSDLQTFFQARRGRYGSFRFLDPNGNLIQYSEDFTQAYWDKSNGPVTRVGATTDPFGGEFGTELTGDGTNAFLMGIVGPSDGGLNGVRMTASIWVKSPDSGAQLFIGFVDSGFTLTNGTTWDLPQNRWKRIWHSATLWNDNYFRILIGGFAAWAGSRTMNMYGAQVVPMKAESMYAKTPGNFGYHENCRFDVDVFERHALGPNQNSLILPIMEFNL